MTGRTADPQPATRVGSWIVFGVAVVALAFGAVGGWGATVPLAGAVVTTGRLTVDTNRKRIQHLEGGIVETLHVRDGDRVATGDVLITLDETHARTSYAIVAAAYREELAREARFIAERDERETIVWPDALLRDGDDPALEAMMASQQAIFASRRETLAGEIDIFEERIGQLTEQIGGIEAQVASADRQISFITEELDALIPLFERGRTTKPRILSLQREKARLEGERGELVASIARARTSIGETRLEILQRRKAFRSEVVSGLREVQAKVNDLRERTVATRDVLDRLEIIAPVAGRVVNLSVHGHKAVIRPGDVVAEIVPSNDALLVEVRVNPQDIDNVAPGQVSEVRLLAFKQRTTPTLSGHVDYVSADALADPQSGAAYYLARIAFSDGELARLEGQPLQPGMPAEALIRTGSRTALAYILQPVIDSMNRAWREP